MKKTSSIVLATMLILGGISVAGPASAAVGENPPPPSGNCHYETETVKGPWQEVTHHDAVPATTKKVIDSAAVTETLFLYTHKETNGASGPADKWEVEGWNAGPKGKGWDYVYPKQSQTHVITPEVSHEEVVTAAIPARDETIQHPAETTQVLVCVEFPPPLTEVTPVPPVFNQATCDDLDGSVNTPSQPEGVEVHDKSLSNTGMDGHPYWVVTFYPLEGFSFPEGTTTTYSFRVDTPSCTPVTPDPIETPVPSIPVTPSQPPVDAVVPVPHEMHKPVGVQTKANQNRGLNVQTAVTAPVKAATVPAKQLAYTGADKTGWALVGGVMLLLGVLLLVLPKLARRKH